MDARMPVLDDAVITMVSTKSYEDLYTADGKEALRQELMQVIASRVSEYHLMNVYFTEFVVQ
jgi:flagellar FliL protein